jgi:hypothetical protein
VNRRVAVAGALFLAVPLAACNPGSGDLTTEVREVDDFDSIEASDAVNVELTVEPGAETSVSVTYDDNLIDQIVTEVRGSTLEISIDGHVSTFGGGRFVAVTVDSLETIEASGAVDVNGEGQLDTYELVASGASDVDFSDLTAVDVTIEISGASDVTLSASGSVTGEVSGASDVTVEGSPNNVVVETSGASDFDVRS